MFRRRSHPRTECATQSGLPVGGRLSGLTAESAVRSALWVRGRLDKALGHRASPHPSGRPALAARAGTFPRPWSRRAGFRPGGRDWVLSEPTAELATSAHSQGRTVTPTGNPTRRRAQYRAPRHRVRRRRRTPPRTAQHVQPHQCCVRPSGPTAHTQHAQPMSCPEWAGHAPTISSRASRFPARPTRGRPGQPIACSRRGSWSYGWTRGSHSPLSHLIRPPPAHLTKANPAPLRVVKIPRVSRNRARGPGAESDAHRCRIGWCGPPANGTVTRASRTGPEDSARPGSVGTGPRHLRSSLPAGYLRSGS